MFQTLEASDLGCGAGGGQNNEDVFRLAGLTFLTNANADDTQENGKMFSIFCLLFKLITEIYIFLLDTVYAILFHNIPYEDLREET